jgi:polysaccharide lyase-like protein
MRNLAVALVAVACVVAHCVTSASASSGHRAAHRPAPAPATSASDVLWTADAESSMATEWASNSSMPEAASPPAPVPTSISQSTFRAQGSRSYRFAIHDGDESFGERAELGEALPAAAQYENRRWFHAGEERWIAMQYYFPANWAPDDTWQTVFQIKPVTPGGGGPDVEMSAGTNRVQFDGNTNEWGSTAGHLFDGDGPLPGGSFPLVRSHWIKITWHLVFSADPALGSVEIFGDLADGQGMRTLSTQHRRETMKYLDGAMDPVHLRVGIYRDPAMTATESLYVDGITVATTRAAAEAGAYRGSS